MSDEDLVSTLSQAWMDATVEASLYGHGFIRISHTGTGFEVQSVKPEEFEAITELMQFIKKNRHEAS